MTGLSITCPRCGRTSQHPDDVREGYCGACHDWTGLPAGVTSGDALREAREIREARQARAGAWMTRGLGPYHHEDPGRYDDDERADECGAQLVTPGPDPYATSCDQPPGHYPASKHEGDDPIFPGPGMRVRWHGGGSCAGDPLPFRDVEWTDGKGGWRP
jgi:hypothetical protein